MSSHSGYFLPGKRMNHLLFNSFINAEVFAKAFLVQPGTGRLQEKFTGANNLIVYGYAL